MLSRNYTYGHPVSYWSEIYYSRHCRFSGKGIKKDNSKERVQMRHETVQSDITVIGGGLAGVSAAVSAARLGKKVALVQNRSVLGGNSSSEIRVWVLGATGLGVNRYARETGIIGEMLVENQYLNQDGNPYYWDLVVLETVLKEPNIQLFLNTNIHEVEATGDETNRTIQSVTGWMMGSERKIRFESPIFLDCSGDGLVGFLGGAKYRIGREAQHEFNEKWAPEAADLITLGSTMFFYTKDAGHPVKYIAPSFAKDITQTAIPMKRVFKSGDSGCHYWWIEWGGEAEIDTLYDNERIRDELWSVIYGIWDYIKNSGKFDADNMTLEWVGSVPGKREYRRFIGDYILTQNDLENQTQFEDSIAFGGWSIDLHPPEGMYASEYVSKLFCVDGTFQIPFRSLYSANVNNLLFAGRNISATHVAFGATRVMATCSVMGEAAGAGAALCVEKGITPRELYRSHIKELQQTLLWKDAAIIGLKHDDPADLASRATVTASSYLSKLEIESPAERFELNNDAAFLVPVDPKLEHIEILLDVNQDTQVEVEVWTTGKAENYIPHSLQIKDTVAVAKGNKQWVRFHLPWSPEKPQNAFVIVRENQQIALYHSDEPRTGTLAFIKEDKANISSLLTALNNDQLVVKWSMKRLVRKPFCFRVADDTNAFEPSHIIDGYLRPYGGPNMWLSAPMKDDLEEWVELQWTAPEKISEVQIIFNDDVNEDLVNLHYKRTPFDVIPELVRNYRIETYVDGEWKVAVQETDNRSRKRIHHLGEGMETARLRLVIENTNGTRFAEVVAIRVM
ncbi:FAD-dependent oxidoreductase [Paenibacillus radicis (ex Xue et al. 2023)]|uniref:FAD-dependent oxidoreductase n=1 Tax=Paenibacillus radicis (ex Xue et al. 2023) TaxID=2972489 RepID=A0ABT1YTJ2_9BACL|nr:FAD-dependent oxidoreductase [Paenibacillus radicis (ex Xue et al. 2023)]MCR8636503.1 FAD-dependent oxidoreductase [Paenibacillus radicis (ex Xue et al. 2023)]